MALLIHFALNSFRLLGDVGVQYTGVHGIGAATTKLRR